MNLPKSALDSVSLSFSFMNGNVTLSSTVTLKSIFNGVIAHFWLKSWARFNRNFWWELWFSGLMGFLLFYLVHFMVCIGTICFGGICWIGFMLNWLTLIPSVNDMILFVTLVTSCGSFHFRDFMVDSYIIAWENDISRSRWKFAPEGWFYPDFCYCSLHFCPCLS